MELEEYTDHLLAGDDEMCLAEAKQRARDLDGLHSLYVDLIQPTQYRVGELWEAGKISVAAEHLATATNSYVASTSYAPLARVDHRWSEGADRLHAGGDARAWAAPARRPARV